MYFESAIRNQIITGLWQVVWSLSRFGKVNIALDILLIVQQTCIKMQVMYAIIKTPIQQILSNPKIMVSQDREHSKCAQLMLQVFSAHPVLLQRKKQVFSSNSDYCLYSQTYHWYSRQKNQLSSVNIAKKTTVNTDGILIAKNKIMNTADIFGSTQKKSEYCGYSRFGAKK